MKVVSIGKETTSSYQKERKNSGGRENLRRDIPFFEGKIPQLHSFARKTKEDNRR